MCKIIKNVIFHVKWFLWNFTLHYYFVHAIWNPLLTQSFINNTIINIISVIIILKI